MEFETEDPVTQIVDRCIGAAFNHFAVTLKTVQLDAARLDRQRTVFTGDKIPGRLDCAVKTVEAFDLLQRGRNFQPVRLNPLDKLGNPP